jgi:putative transposase
MAYTSTMSDEGWNFIEEMFSRRSSNAGRPPVWDRRTIVDAILYVVKNGVTWRDLPRDFPPWKTVYHYFRSWSLSGLWRDVSLILVEAERLAAGREESPSLASVDSQSQTAEPGVSERGLDGGKLVNGRKRHIAVDVQGLLLACFWRERARSNPERSEGSRTKGPESLVRNIPPTRQDIGRQCIQGCG